MTSVFDLKGKHLYGMHGCGYYSGTVHANTYEGFKYWQGKGVKIMEVDISKTTDGEFVALAHKMTPEYLRRLEIRSFDDKDVFTHGWFMRQKLFRYSTRGLHPLDLRMMVEELRRDEELIIMFDLWGMWSFEETNEFAMKLNGYARGDEDIIQRSLLEAYNQYMIDGIRSVAGKTIPIIYCVRENSTGGNHQWKSPQELKEQGINIVSYPWHYTSQYVGEMKQYVEEDFTVFSYCVNFKRTDICQLGGANVVLVDLAYNNINRFYRYPNYLVGRLKNKIINKLLRKIS